MPETHSARGPLLRDDGIASRKQAHLTLAFRLLYMTGKFASILKHWLSVLIKIGVGLLISVLLGAVSAIESPLIWPSLNKTIDEPKIEQFCGRYIPMPDTARLLRDDYPGTQTWLEFNRDGSFAFNAMPTASGNATEMEHGKWEIENGQRGISITILDGAGDPITSFNLKGQKPPYVLETWNEKHLCTMGFCTNPQQSPAIRAYTSLSITDWVIQGFIAISVLVLPFFLHPGSGSRAFGYPFLIILAWGIWRMFYFDVATNNGVPGGGYLVCAFAYALVASGIFAVRCAVLHSKNTRSVIQGDSRENAAIHNS